GPISASGRASGRRRWGSPATKNRRGAVRCSSTPVRTCGGGAACHSSHTTRTVARSRRFPSHSTPASSASRTKTGHSKTSTPRPRSIGVRSFHRQSGEQRGRLYVPPEVFLHLVGNQERGTQGLGFLPYWEQTGSLNKTGEPRKSTSSDSSSARGKTAGIQTPG